MSGSWECPIITTSCAHYPVSPSSKSSAPGSSCFSMKMTRRNCANKKNSTLIPQELLRFRKDTVGTLRTTTTLSTFTMRSTICKQMIIVRGQPGEVTCIPKSPSQARSEVAIDIRGIMAVRWMTKMGMARCSTMESATAMRISRIIT